jgi:hypothetical protein
LDYENQNCYKVKAHSRKVKARTDEALGPAIAKALDAITPEDIEGWIRDCGYGLQ